MYQFGSCSRIESAKIEQSFEMKIIYIINALYFISNQTEFITFVLTNQISIMNNYQNIIVRNPTIMGGKPIIKGTRITVELILKKLSEGISVGELVKLYPHITQLQILATLEYASDIIGNEELLEVS
jgi:uncharacterized protein (DUF433 family)